MIATFYAQFRGKNAGGGVIYFFVISGFFFAVYEGVFELKKKLRYHKKKIMPYRLVFFSGRNVV